MLAFAGMTGGELDTLLCGVVLKGCPKLTGTYFSLFQTTKDTKSTKKSLRVLRALRGEKITCFWTTP